MRHITLVWGDHPIFQRLSGSIFCGSTVQCSESSVVRRLICLKIQWSDGSVGRMFSGPNLQWSQTSISLNVYFIAGNEHISVSCRVRIIKWLYTISLYCMILFFIIWILIILFIIQNAKNFKFEAHKMTITTSKCSAFHF